MEWNSLNEEKQAEIIISTLLSLSSVDNHQDNLELNYIYQIASQIGLNSNRVNELLVAQVEIGFKAPPQESIRMTMLYYLLFLMKVDRKITKEEERMIFTFGFKLGFHELMIRDLILVIRQHLGKKVPPHILIDEVKKYLN